MDNKESSYIRKRKLKAFRESILYYIFRILPIRKNRIAVTTFEGKGGFCCNPKYIVKELHKRDPELEFIWLVNDPDSKEFPDYIRKVKNDIWHRAYYLTTSKVWIDNYRKPLGTKKRKGQFYVNTWHGSIGFKKIGLWRGTQFSRIAYLVSKNDSDMIDYILSDSRWTDIAFRKGMIYSGEFKRYGQAREDILIKREDIKLSEIREQFGIPVDSFILLYVPTYREQHQKTDRSVYLERSSIDFDRVRQTIKKMTGNDCYIFYKLHPQLAGLKVNSPYNYMVDVTSFDDVYEIMAISDAIITDYSSLAFEAAEAKIPAFLFMDDLKEYKSDRGGLFFEISNDYHMYPDEKITPGMKVRLPFSIAENNDELNQNITGFDRQIYENQCDEMIKCLEIVCDGKASGRASDLIEKLL